MVTYSVRRRQDGGWEAVVEGSFEAFMVFDTRDDVTAFLNAMLAAEADVKSHRRSPTKSAGTRAMLVTPLPDMNPAKRTPR